MKPGVADHRGDYEMGSPVDAGKQQEKFAAWRPLLVS